MWMTRRDFVKQASIASVAVPAIAQAQGGAAVQTKETVNPLPVRVGMTDWNLGQRGDIAKIALGREIGLDGIQVSVQYPTDATTPTLRDPKTQAAFKRAALENGIQICSLAIGNPGKSRMPMHTSPLKSAYRAEKSFPPAVSIRSTGPIPLRIIDALRNESIQGRRPVT